MVTVHSCQIIVIVQDEIPAYKFLGQHSGEKIFLRQVLGGSRLAKIDFPGIKFSCDYCQFTFTRSSGLRQN